MVVEEPVGSLATSPINTSGLPIRFRLNYCAVIMLVAMAELTAVGKYIQFLVSGDPHLGLLRQPL